MPFQINLCRGYKHRKNGFKPLFLSLRCGCPVDTSAKQKHRPSRQARPPLGARQSVSSVFVIAKPQSDCGNPFFPFREIRILSRFTFRMTNRLVIASAEGVRQSVFMIFGFRFCRGVRAAYRPAAFRRSASRRYRAESDCCRLADRPYRPYFRLYRPTCRRWWKQSLV